MPAALKGLVLSGGAGTRLRPITHTSAKQLVPVANKPVLFYGLEALRAAGVTDVGIVVGETRAEIEAAVGDGSALGIQVTYIPQEAPLGLAHAVLTAEAFLGDSPFVMYLGDNLLRDGITALVDRFRAGASDALILLQRVPDPQSYGVAELEDGQVVRLVEKPAEPRSDLALVGVYMFSPSIMESVKAIRPSARGELEITDAIQHLIDRGLSVEPHEVTGWWKDTGRLEDMLEANRLVLDVLETRVDGEVVDSTMEGRVVVERGARVASSSVRGPGHHRRGGGHRARLRGPLHRDLGGRGGAPGRGGEQHPAGGQPRGGPRRARGEQPHRAQRDHRPQRDEAARLPVHGRRLIGHRAGLEACGCS